MFFLRCSRQSVMSFFSIAQNDKGCMGYNLDKIKIFSIFVVLKQIQKT